WRSLLRHTVAWLFSFTRESAGSSNAARIAIMAITTSSSIKVKPMRSADPVRSSECGVGNWTSAKGFVLTGLLRALIESFELIADLAFWRGDANLLSSRVATDHPVSLARHDHHRRLR